MFRILLIILYLSGLAGIIWGITHGWEYYMMPLIERPHAELNSVLKPGGFIGHGYGIVGSAMILLLFLYSARKRERFGLRFGKMNRWLDIHIWFGIMGPLFITLHTAGKFSGIVSVSYFSMMAVMISGFLGRYLYIKIPRDDAGHELSLVEIDNTLDSFSESLKQKFGEQSEIIKSISQKIIDKSSNRRSGVSALISLIFSDITTPLRNRKLKKRIQRLLPDMSVRQMNVVFNLLNNRIILQRKKDLHSTLTSIFHLWHVIHKPFAIIMIVIMFVHIIVVILMGYKWIF